MLFALFQERACLGNGEKIPLIHKTFCDTFKLCERVREGGTRERLSRLIETNGRKNEDERERPTEQKSDRHRPTLLATVHHGVFDKSKGWEIMYVCIFLCLHFWNQKYPTLMLLNLQRFVA